MSALAASGLGHAATVLRLLGDLVRIKGFTSFTWLCFLPSVSAFILDKQLDPGWLIAGSMGVASLASIGGDRLYSREFRVLPLTDRDLWVARWIRATCLIPAALLFYKCGLMAMAAWRGQSLFTPDTLMLSTLFDAVYAGAFLPVPLWLETEGRVLARRLGSSAFAASLALMLFALPVAIAVPLLFARSLPKHLHDFSTAGVLTLTAGITMAAAALRWTPHNGGASSATWERAFVPAAPAPAPARLATTDNRMSLKGLPVVLWSHAKSTFIAALMAMLIAVVIAPFLPPEPDPFRFLSTLVMVFALLGTTTMGGVWTSWTRRLKVLPLSTKAINGIWVLTPFLTWLAIWAAVVLTHVVVQRPLHVEHSPVAMFLCAAAAALTQAVVAPSRGIVLVQTAASMIGIALTVGIAVTFAEHPEIPRQLVMLAVGALSLILAAAINHFTLTRSTSSARIYRNIGTPGRP